MLKHFALALHKNTLKWFQAHLVTDSNQAWDDLKQKFFKIFGRTSFELDSTEENGKMLASKDSLRYVFHMSSYMQITNPTASELDKTNKLIDGLPRNLKPYFVSDTPKTVHESTERLRAVATEIAYKQSSLLQAGPSPSIVAAIAGSSNITAISPLITWLNSLTSENLQSAGAISKPA